jgi:hypothetical protein
MASALRNSSPVETVRAFLACVKTKDVEYMRKAIHPKATACLIREDEPRFISLNEAIDNLGKAEQEHVEVIWDEVEHVDGDYATVWTKFSIDQDGEASSTRNSVVFPTNPSLQLHQTGSSSYSCWKSPSEGWIIMTMSDIARPPNTADHA